MITHLCSPKGHFSVSRNFTKIWFSQILCHQNLIFQILCHRKKIPPKWFLKNSTFENSNFQNKVGCISPTVIWPKFRTGFYRDHDYREGAPHFTWSKTYFTKIFLKFFVVKCQKKIVFFSSKKIKIDNR